MGIAAWAAGGGVAASQERRGGGEAVTEGGGGSSQPGGRESVATAHSPPPQRVPRSSSSEEGRVWTGQPQQTGAEKQHTQHKRLEWRRHRLVPGNFGGGGGGSSTGGGGSGGGCRDDGTRSCDEQGSSSEMDVGEGAKESLGSRKRRTPSPDTGRESFSREDAPAPLVWRKGAGGGMSGQGEAEDPDSSLIRWCKKVASPPVPIGGTASGASSGEEEKFFAGRVLEPVPRRRPLGVAFGSEGWAVEPDSPVSRQAGGGGQWDNDSGGGGSGCGGGEGRGDDARGSAARRRVDGTTLPTAINPGGARCTAGMTATASAGAIATGGGASASPSTLDGMDATSHGGGGESFFASYALEPSPRPGWCREAFAGGGARDAHAASGMVDHALAQRTVTPGAGRSSDSPLLSGEVRGSSSEFGVTPSRPPSTVGGSNASARIGQAFRSARSTDAMGEGWREGAPAVAVATPPTGVAAAAAAAAEVDTNNGDWEVQPEAMAAFFTTVVGVDPPGTTMAGRRGVTAASVVPRPRPHPPPPPLPASSLRSSQPPLRRVSRFPPGTPEPLAASSSGGMLAAADLATTAAAASVATAAAATARGTASAVAMPAAAGAAVVATTAATTAAAAAGGAADPWPDSSESCSMSIWTDSGIGGGEGNSWGW